LGVRVAGAAHRPQSPFANRPRGIPRLPEDLGDCQSLRAEGVLPLVELGESRLGLQIAADLRMAKMAACQEHAA